ncbi:MAG TPA: hypothetical protein VE463_05610 [Blastococcus sp.]|nr:hypothetical protein [Blastococcus sp.]
MSTGTSTRARTAFRRWLRSAGPATAMCQRDRSPSSTSATVPASVHSSWPPIQ